MTADLADLADKAAPPRDGLRRSAPFELVRADEGSDGLTLEGYAAVFDTPTRIDSWEGCFDEQIAHGAFRKTLRENTPVLQFDHGSHPLIGSIPIGTITEAAEDDRGLYVRARLTDNWLIQPVRDAIADGGVTGMSFRFTVIREEWRDNAGKVIRADELPRLLWEPGDRGPLQRTLKELRVAELGPVVWPAYKETSVGVRSRELARTLHADPELRAEFARALLLDSVEQQTSNADTETERDADEPAAPPEDGHPEGESAERTDAPPPDGHPSTDQPTSRLTRSRLRRDAQYRAEYLALITKGAQRYERA